MNKNKIFWLIAVLFAAFSFVSCEDESGSGDGTDDGYGYDFSNIIKTYVDNVVVATYTDMKDRATDLYDAVVVYEEEQMQDNLNAVCAAWRAMRIPWEQSEGFLFGPADLLNLDPSLDSWPLDKGSIDRILNSNLEITSDAISSSNVHGFHAIEYLIFAEGDPKTTILTDREIQYLVAATEYLRLDTYQLWANWVGQDDIDDDIVLEVFEEEEIEAKYNFAENFKNAGKAGSTFKFQDDAIDQIVEGCTTIADEVGAQKIGGPNGLAIAGNKEQAVLEVESWYSWNSIEDYANNIVSIRNSYFGGRGLTAGNPSANSLSAFVKSKNTALDTEITNAIEKAYNAIAEGMDRPFRNNLTGQKVEDAKDACAELVLIFEKIKTLKD